MQLDYANLIHHIAGVEKLEQKNTTIMDRHDKEKIGEAGVDFAYAVHLKPSAGKFLPKGFQGFQNFATCHKVQLPGMPAPVLTVGFYMVDLWKSASGLPQEIQYASYVGFDGVFQKDFFTHVSNGERKQAMEMTGNLSNTTGFMHFQSPLETPCEEFVNHLKNINRKSLHKLVMKFISLIPKE
ncbi:hypothetical protein AGMMS49975_25090 [Clostridia bacterium]|nr:hypothetical protein AGMMS49975_25090 [Clostridia bacterium]